MLVLPGRRSAEAAGAAGGFPVPLCCFSTRPRVRHLSLRTPPPRARQRAVNDKTRPARPAVLPIFLWGQTTTIATYRPIAATRTRPAFAEKSTSWCSNPRSGRRLVHRAGLTSSSTPPGLRSYSDTVHTQGGGHHIDADQWGGDMWKTTIHNLWITDGPSIGQRVCPPLAHRNRAVVPSSSTPLSTVRKAGRPHHRFE